jgi:prevent-host-death family protein
MKPAINSKPASLRKNLKVTPSNRLQNAPGQECSYTATEAKNEFGRLLDRAMQGSVVVITKHDAPKVVLISVEKFSALQRAPQLRLDALSAEFDDLLARMQTPAARGSMERAFNASPKQLGKAAVLAARKRG